MKVQVDTTHYNFLKYVDQNRWNSYYQQIFEALNCKGKNILYIGAGDSVVTDVLKKYGKNVKTLDFDKNLKPDYVGSVTDVKNVLGKDKFDVIMCCQVLEHIPFSKFETTIKQLSEYTKEKLILSLPNNNRKYLFSFQLPRPLGKRKKIVLIKRHFAEPWDINKHGGKEHYWEIDAKACPTRKEIKNIVKKYFLSLKFYTLFENPYHMFFILEK
ncbi:methyltransferase domain-containing protein [Candidatus Saccharibacteria bacterium]|nr:methyltransferase domain-containing protein [Candidatus Saccharibacteria bacterium]